MAKITPTQRSLALLKKEGWSCWIVEHWNPFSRTRLDLYNFIDILCIKEGFTLGVQTTSRANIRARETKILLNEHYPLIKQANWLIEIHGWGKLKIKGTNEYKWDCKILKL